jgi:hypothetical protein
MAEGHLSLWHRAAMNQKLQFLLVMAVLDPAIPLRLALAKINSVLT